MKLTFAPYKGGILPISGEWWPSPWKVNGIRVWTRQQGPGLPNLYRVGRYGRQEFMWYSQGQVPHLL